MSLYAAAAVRDVPPPLASQIVDTNLRATAAHLRKLAEEEEDQPRRHVLRDAIVDLDRVRHALERIQ